MYQVVTVQEEIAVPPAKINMDLNESVQESIGEWRQHITANFYNCTIEIFRGLGDLYVSDERFTANIDKYRPGLANFMKNSIDVYCDNHGSK